MGINLNLCILENLDLSKAQCVVCQANMIQVFCIYLYVFSFLFQIKWNCVKPCHVSRRLLLYNHHEPWQNETKQIHCSWSVCFGKLIAALFYTHIILHNVKEIYVCLVVVIKFMFLFSFPFSAFLQRLC